MIFDSFHQSKKKTCQNLLQIITFAREFCFYLLYLRKLDSILTSLCILILTKSLSFNESEK